MLGILIATAAVWMLGISGFGLWLAIRDRPDEPAQVGDETSSKQGNVIGRQEQE